MKEDFKFLLKMGVSFIFAVAFAVTLGMGLVGVAEGTGQDQCTVDRPVEYIPSYLAACALFGKELPKFEK